LTRIAPTEAPAILVGIDTEADNQWSEAARRRLEVSNAGRLPDLQALFERHGVRPTYLVTHEMAATDASASVLRELGQGGRCEIGAHLHPWSQPPLSSEQNAGHPFPSQLETGLLNRQLTDLTRIIEERLGVRPTTYRAGRWGLDERALPVLEALGYTVDTSVDPLLNETRKGGPLFAGAPSSPYRPAYGDVRVPGSARLLEVPVSSGTLPYLGKSLEQLYVRLPPLRFRGALKRLGLRPAWLRPSYTSVEEMKALASGLAQRGSPCFNIAFHSSELLAGGSPYSPDQSSVDRLLGDLEALLDHLTGRLGGVGRTFQEFASVFGTRAA
jgi:hypothetical protein